MLDGAGETHVRYLQADAYDEVGRPLRMTGSIHLVGGFPDLAVRDVLVLQQELLGSRLLAFSDGRVHSQKDWQGWLAAEDRHAAGRWLPYAGEATMAFDIFHQLQASGAVPDGAKLQLSFPIAIGRRWPDPVGLSPEHDGVFNRALAEQIQRIIAAHPGGKLSIQLELPYADRSEDLRAEVGCERANQQARFVDAALSVIDAVPNAANLALHFDCRDGASFALTPQDAGTVAVLAQRILARARRRIDLVHVPVPLRHEDDGYFRALSGLETPRATRLYLGLIHLSDGLEGARRRIAFARQHCESFGIAARSGFAARTPDSIRPFLALHAAVANDMATSTKDQGEAA